SPGPVGPPGQPGAHGADGTPGIPGAGGLPGADAAYCPCPARTYPMGRSGAVNAYRTRVEGISSRRSDFLMKTMWSNSMDPMRRRAAKRV
ncbi:unnamed protein product, partial [Nippostrongylus brasiliensis]|uniref:Collagen triple helix repeat protein n=1 Tax=Nippostrongylus brasiliensis TaxID=27835 RepID=A0A0N4YQA3_NIPBR